MIKDQTARKPGCTAKRPFATRCYVKTISNYQAPVTFNFPLFYNIVVPTNYVKTRQVCKGYFFEHTSRLMPISFIKKRVTEVWNCE